jgi:hypothetical protein
VNPTPLLPANVPLFLNHYCDRDNFPSSKHRARDGTGTATAATFPQDTATERHERNIGTGIPPEEDMRRLFTECKIGVNLLSEVLVMVMLETLGEAVEFLHFSTCTSPTSTPHPLLPCTLSRLG